MPLCRRAARPNTMVIELPLSRQAQRLQRLRDGPHLNPIERLWGLMHRNVTHNKCYATCAQFADATLGFLRETGTRNWADLCDSVTDNFRVINPKDFRVMT